MESRLRRPERFVTREPGAGTASGSRRAATAVPRLGAAGRVHGPPRAGVLVVLRDPAEECVDKLPLSFNQCEPEFVLDEKKRLNTLADDLEARANFLGRGTELP